MSERGEGNRQRAGAHPPTRASLFGHTSRPALSPIHAPAHPPHHQDYVRARLVQFAGAFAARAAPGLGPADVRAAAAAAIAGLPPPERGGGPAARELQLVFRHDCL